MSPAQRRELSPQRRAVLRRAVRLEALSIAYLISDIGLIAMVMGSSQVMKASLVESILALLAPISFLVALPLRDREAGPEFPYGYHRATSIAFLVASASLAALGAYLLFESGKSLLTAERPTIGAVSIFGVWIWQGWLMLLVLGWTSIPAVFLGRAKIDPARKLHDKVLYADAQMNNADWKSGVAGALGVLGIAVGWWWADAVAAMAISIDIFYDGYRNLRASVLDLMDRAPHTVDHSANEGLPARIATELKKLEWVRDARVRLRENGHVFFGEVFVEPVDDREALAKLAEARERIHRLDWRIFEVVVTLVEEADAEPGRE